MDEEREEVVGLPHAAHITPCRVVNSSSGPCRLRMYQVMSSIALRRCPVIHRVIGTAGIAMKDRISAPTSCSRSPDTMAAATAHTMAPKSTMRIAHCQNDHSFVAAVHSRGMLVSNCMFCATRYIAAVALSAMPRPAFSKVMQTTSPTLHPYATVMSLPPDDVIASP